MQPRALPYGKKDGPWHTLMCITDDIVCADSPLENTNRSIAVVIIFLTIG